MVVNANQVLQGLDTPGNPVELLVVGCPMNVADGFANALRNQGQAAHVKVAEALDSLDQQLANEPSDLIVVNADVPESDCVQAIAKIRAANPTASVILVAQEPDRLRALAIEHGLQDLIAIDDQDHLALAVRREHQTLQMRREIARLQHQLQEAEERSNLLVQSSRDAIAYIHEGMYLNANQAYLDRFGYEAFDEVDGLPIMDMIDAQSRTDFKTALRKLEDNDKYVGEFQCVTADGEHFTARMEFSAASIDGESCTQVMIRDQSQNLALQQRIDELTHKDAQTGFYNRQAFMDRLDALLASEAGAEKSHTLVQLSITNYSEVREDCGFDCAEQMLAEVADVLNETAANAHTLARFGDHDFMLMCDDGEPALKVAERCLHNLRTHTFASLQNALVKPIYSVGVTRADKGEELSAHELINRSCRATGIARAEGENRVIFYNDHIPSATSGMTEADAEVVKAIDDALANDRFRLKFQPIVSLQGDTRENYSVYLRMVDDNNQEVVPDVFLSPAHHASRLAEIDRWVVCNAVRELASHRKDGKKIVFYIILSRAGIEDDSMLLWICDCLREFRAKGAWLVFQFREADLRAALQPAKELIDGLRKINCRIAIANYHDAEGSDALLKRLEIDIVKLSPELMRDLGTQAAQQDKMRSINSRLQEGGYKTIASGVEDAGSLAILWNIGVNYIQGYFLQEPSSTITFDEDQ